MGWKAVVAGDMASESPPPTSNPSFTTPFQHHSNPPTRYSQVITLNSVSIIVSEFIPYGANSMVTTNMNLGSQERVQGGLFTPGIETDKVAIKLYVKPGLTKVGSSTS